jgi:hypothetical protein
MCSVWTGNRLASVVAVAGLTLGAIACWQRVPARRQRRREMPMLWTRGTSACQAVYTQRFKVSCSTALILSPGV